MYYIYITSDFVADHVIVAVCAVTLVFPDSGKTDVIFGANGK